MSKRVHIAWWIAAFHLFIVCGPKVDINRASAQPADTNKLNILFISSFNNIVPAQSAIESGLDQALHFRTGAHNLYFEFMDSPLLKAETVQETFAVYLARKYQGITFDFCVGWAPAASAFIAGNSHLFSSARRVYVETGSPFDLGRPPEDNETFVVAQLDYHTTIMEVMARERPRRILVIGTSKDLSSQSRLKSFKKALGRDTQGVQVEYLLDQSISQVGARLERAARKQTVVFYLLMFSDGEGSSMTPYAVAQQLAERSAAPIYSFWESLMGSGIVGGYVLSLEKNGYNLGQALLSLSSGTSVGQSSPMRYTYDWNALQRWNIAETRLPAGSNIIHRPPDLLAQYRWHIVVAATAILMLSVLSLFLIRALRLRNNAVNALGLERQNLSKTVDHRTRELLSANRALSREVDARRQSETEKGHVIEKLETALKEIKSLKGILPICSFCKKIRDDKGYWEQVDIYIRKYSGADFSHSVCPDCMEKEYGKPLASISPQDTDE